MKFAVSVCFFSQALHNTHLLATYAAIDRRVKILCYVMKVFAKVNMLYRLVTKTSLSVLVIVLFNIKCCFHFHYRCVTLEMRHVVASRHMPTPSWCCSSFSRETHQLSLCCKRYRCLFERRANFILFTNKLHIDVLIWLCECSLKYIYPLKLKQQTYTSIWMNLSTSLLVVVI